jgi:probable rRNA maturation factor
MANIIHLDVQMASSTSTPNEILFQQWAQLAAAEFLNQQNEDQELTIRIVDEEESQRLNHYYRGKDKPTNVLSFPYEQAPGLHVPLLGDLVICAPVVSHEAAQQQKPIEAHWAHMILHGVLHLLGYDHIQTEEAEKMEKLEVTLLAKLGYANPYV